MQIKSFLQTNKRIIQWIQLIGNLLIPVALYYTAICNNAILTYLLLGCITLLMVLSIII
jgi:hypothetical protein